MINKGMYIAEIIISDREEKMKTKLELQIADDELYEKEQREEEIGKEIIEDLSRNYGINSGLAFEIMLNIKTGKIRHVIIDYGE